MNDFIAYCGLDCEKCQAHIATIKNDDALREKVAKEWSDLNKVEITYDMITNDLGEQPDSVGASTGNQGFINYVEMYITGFSDDTKTIIIEYKGNEFYYKGRHFRIEIDLPENKG